MTSSTTTNDHDESAPAPSGSNSVAGSGQADLAQAYRDLLRGEQAATALEANLTNLERKLDDMLAAFEAAVADDAEERPENGDDRDERAPSTQSDSK